MAKCGKKCEELWKAKKAAYGYAIDYDASVMMDLAFFVIEVLFGLTTETRHHLHLYSLIGDGRSGAGEFQAIHGAIPSIKLFREGLDCVTTKFLAIVHEGVHYLHWEKTGLEEERDFIEFVAIVLDMAVAKHFGWVELQESKKYKMYNRLRRVASREGDSGVELVVAFLKKGGRKESKAIRKIINQKQSQ